MKITQTTSIGSYIPLSTVGRVPFIGSNNLLADDNDFFWDNTNKRLGLGTTTPSDTASWGRTFDIRGSDASTGSVVYFGNSSGTLRSYVGFYGGGYGFLGTQTTHPYTFWTSNIERMRITSSGNIGIGTTAPGALLHVAGNTYISGGNFFTDNWNGYTGGVMTVSSGTGGLRVVTGSGGYFRVTDASDNTLFRVNNAGNVGVNVNSPLAKFHAYDSTALTALTGTGAGTILVKGGSADGHYSKLSFDVAQNAPISAIGCKQTASGSYLCFGTSNNYTLGVTNENLVMDYYGSVGIGTGASGAIGYRFSVVDNGSVTGGGNAAASFQAIGANAYLRVASYTTTNVSRFGIETNRDFIVYNDTADTYRLILDNNGNLVVGSTTTDSRFQAVSTSNYNRSALARFTGGYLGAGNSLFFGHENTEYLCSLGAGNTNGYPYLGIFCYHSSTNNTLKRASGTNKPARFFWNSSTDMQYQTAPTGTVDADITDFATRFKITSDGYVYVSAPTSAPADASLDNGQCAFWIDESGNNLKFKVKYSGGTVKTGTLAVS